MWLLSHCIPVIIERRQKDGVTSIVFSVFINTAIIRVNNYSKCECWLQIPPVVCYGRDAFTHQIWMKWMLMCSIIVLNHGHQWGWVEHVYCCCSAGSTDKASLLKMMELYLLMKWHVCLFFLSFSLSSPSFPDQGSHIWSYARFLPVFFFFW